MLTIIDLMLLSCISVFSLNCNERFSSIYQSCIQFKLCIAVALMVYQN